MDWLVGYVRRHKTADYAPTILQRARLGSKAGGAIQGVRVLAGPDSCSACAALAGIAYDPDQAPVVPVATCSHPAGCRCAYAAVMTYEGESWPPDHRPKPAGYARPILARLRLAVRAGGAIRGVRVVAAPDCCPACAAAGGTVYDPEQAPVVPIASCANPTGCRCAYAAVMRGEGQTRESAGAGGRDEQHP